MKRQLDCGSAIVCDERTKSETAGILARFDGFALSLPGVQGVTGEEPSAK